MKRFVIIDGNGILHRAYHAYPVLNARDGTAVNAVYGFFAMLLNIIRDLKPDYLAVCFDRPKPTFRQSLYVGYHANRPQLADDFVPQIVKVHELLEKMQAQIFEVDGYEGDDVIGTLSSQVQNSSKGEIETIIVSGDRDMLQLVNEYTRVCMPQTGITKTVLFDEQMVFEKYGVRTSQFVDYKALIGDASDGYPGVSGIGPKTAAALLREHETFENLYQNLPKLSPKISEKLATDAEQAALAKKLAQIVTDVPLSFSLTNCRCNNFAMVALRQEFEVLGFKSLVARIDERYPEKKVLVKKEKKKENGQLGLL